MMAYYPDDALAEVKAFLATSQTHGGLQKSTTSVYPDRKVAEAGWVLEASLNYLKNVNLTKPTLREITRTVEVENYTDATGELLISGTDLTAKFDAFMTDLSTEESTDGSTAKLADARITSVTPTKTILEVKIDMGKTGTTYQPMGGGCCPFPGELTMDEGLEELGKLVNIHLAKINCPESENPYGGILQCKWHTNVGNILTEGENGRLGFPLCSNGICSGSVNPNRGGLRTDLAITPENCCYPFVSEFDEDIIKILDVINWEVQDLISGNNNACRTSLFLDNCCGSIGPIQAKIGRHCYGDNLGSDCDCNTMAVDEIIVASSFAY